MNKKTLLVAILSIVLILTMFSAYSIREAQADENINILVHKSYQNDPKWKDDKLDKCKDKTIGDYGCSLTCWTMLINTALEELGIHLKGSDDNIGPTMSYTPEELNDLLNNYHYKVPVDKQGNHVSEKDPAFDHMETRDGWGLLIDDETQKPVGEANGINVGILTEAVKKDTASRSSNSFGLSLNDMVRSGDKGLGEIGSGGVVLNDKYQWVLDELRKGVPVMVRVNDNKHSVLVTSYHRVKDQRGWYDIADPVINSAGRTITNLQSYGNRIYSWGMYVFEEGGQPVPYTVPSPYYIDPEHLYDPLANPDQYGPELIEPIFPYSYNVSTGPIMDTLQFKFYNSQSSLFSALLNGDIGLMAWPLTTQQYQQASTDASITLAPYPEQSYYGIAINSYATDPSHPTDRKAMNYTAFRQAMACLVDKDGLISGPTVNGLGTRIDTAVPRPTQDYWVNFGDSKYDSNGNLINNYPWDYNETHALEILWTNGWYSHTTYPTLASLLAAPLPLPIGSVVYPPGHPRAGQPIDKIVAYIRSDHAPRKQAGEALVTEMTKLGIGTTVIEGGSSVTYIPVFVNHDYDFYTYSASFGRFTDFSIYTPAYIDPGGLNVYMIDDADLTYHATMEYQNATSFVQSIAEAKICQDIMVQQAYFIPLYSPASYIAYRTSMLGVINARVYGLTSNLDFTFLNCKSKDFNPGPPPVNDTITYGTLLPPDQINPIFSSRTWDYEVTDRIFTSIMATNPYKPTVPGKSPGGGDLPWMVYDWKYEQMPNGNANITYWFRQDITWQDGYPFTVDDFNYTMYLYDAYDDSWAWYDMQHVIGFQKWDDWTCSVQFDLPTIYMLYTVNYDIIPQHIYQYIDVPSPNDYTTGHHGEWPGKQATITQVHDPLNYTQLQLDGDQVWIGTDMWEYRPGSYVSGTDGGIILDAYPGFWMSVLPGEIDFDYYWNSGPAPQGGSYKIGLADLVMLANAYGTNGNGHQLPFKLGGVGVWEPGCDIEPPAGVGLSDLVTLAQNYGKTWSGN
jgi:hypothetical protein